jgi:transcriptional regulator CtsR
MKKSLADGIEQYVKVLIARSENGQIEIQRAEIAEAFSCVPSQVTYVLSTRFTEKNGYYTESRRGGQGYIRITEFRRNCISLPETRLLFDFLDGLNQERLINRRETELLKHIVFKIGEDLPAETKMQVYKGFVTALRQFLKN